MTPADSRRTPDDDETRLIRQAQEGDRSAFARVVADYYDRLYRWLFQLTRDVHQAEDLTQETLLKAFAGLRRFRAGSNFRAWLFRIAHNCFITQRRGVRRRETLPEDLATAEEGPVEKTLQAEWQGLLDEAVARLPAEFRAAFLLRTQEGLSFRQIAETMNLTEETARWRVFKARQKLLDALTPSMKSDPP